MEHFLSMTRSRVLMTKPWEKFTAEKKFIFFAKIFVFIQCFLEATGNEYGTGTVPISVGLKKKKFFYFIFK
jgi:hypothetical protein